MAIRTLAIALTTVAGGAALKTPFPEDIFGVWKTKPGTTPQAILGPLSYELLDFHKGAFSALRDSATGDVWFTLLVGQVWHVKGSEVQYCFGEGILFEQSPFSVDTIGESSVTMCWRKGLRGMPTQTVGCSGCDCAKIEVALNGTKELTFTFWMSPPVIHIKQTLVRHGREPSMLDIRGTMLTPYDQCKITADHYGPNLPGEPDLRNKTVWPQASGFEAALAPANERDVPKELAHLRPGCARGILRHMKEKRPEVIAALVKAEADALAPELGGRKCRQLNGLNHLLDGLQPIPAHKTHVPDVRVQYIKPKGACNPCDVSYSVSAAINEDEYISLGFKGQSWEAKFPYPPEFARPCYFGMCVDSYDNYTTDRIAVGYASSSHGSCMREMGMPVVAGKPVVVGKPVDVEHPMMRATSVERHGKRTILRFTVSQHWATSGTMDGPFRVMWAIGSLTGGTGCQADFGFHGLQRAVHPINWLAAIGSTPCTFSSFEMGRE